MRLYTPRFVPLDPLVPVFGDGRNGSPICNTVSKDDFRGKHIHLHILFGDFDTADWGLVSFVLVPDMRFDQRYGVSLSGRRVLESRESSSQSKDTILTFFKLLASLTVIH
jgi:hypothetical protein